VSFEVESGGIDPELVRAVPVVEARLGVVFPLESPERIRVCVDHALGRAGEARVRNFLPILVERWATAELRATA